MPASGNGGSRARDGESDGGRALPLSAPTVAAVAPTTAYFIMKSLTLDDVYLSQKMGVWATQPHNEKTLHAAFEVP